MFGFERTSRVFARNKDNKLSIKKLQVVKVNKFYKSIKLSKVKCLKIIKLAVVFVILCS